MSNESGTTSLSAVATSRSSAQAAVDANPWRTRIPWLLTGVSIVVSICSLIVAGFSYNANLRYASSQARMQFLRDIYGQYSDFSLKRMEYWYLTHLFIVPDADGGYAEYDRALQSVRHAVQRDSPERQREYQLKEEGLVTLILTKYEQGLYQMDEADRIGDVWLREFLAKEVVGYFRSNLIRNPRVLHYWDSVGQLFSERLRSDVAQQVAGKSLRRDTEGPFLNIDGSALLTQTADGSSPIIR